MKIDDWLWRWKMKKPYSPDLVLYPFPSITVQNAVQFTTCHSKEASDPTL